MDQNTGINRVTIVGTGLVGGSWAACFLAHGLDVVATDPAPEAKDKVRHYVEAAWPALTRSDWHRERRPRVYVLNLISNKPLKARTWCRKALLNASLLR